MEFSHTITYSDLVAFIAVLISLLSVAVHVMLFRISDQRSAESNNLATEANKTAKGAYEFARFNHKERIQPKLTARYMLIPTYKDLDVLFIIKNESFGKATIESLKPQLPYGNEAELLQADYKEFNVPFDLRYNNDVFLIVRFDRIPPKINEAVIQRIFPIEADDRSQVLTVLSETAMFKVCYYDEIGTEYNTTLMFTSSLQKYVSHSPKIIKDAQ